MMNKQFIRFNQMNELLVKKYLLAGMVVIAFTAAVAVLAQTQTVNTLPVPGAVSIPAKPLPPAQTSNVVDFYAPVSKKCGVNSFTMLNDCGIGAFKNVRVQCYDGYEETLGDGASCKSSETWAQYVKEVCANRCGPIKGPTVLSKPFSVPAPVESGPISVSRPIPVCYISDKLTKEYNEFILQLQKAESAGDKAMVEEVTKKIIALKAEIVRSQKECAHAVPVQSPTEVPKPISIGKPIAINVDRCNEVVQWENKIAYYKKLNDLNDVDLKKESSFSREEIEKILKELASGIEGVRKQCKLQGETAITITRPIPITSGGGGGGVSISNVLATIAEEPVKPVVVESGQEISTYYRAKLEKASTIANTDEQVTELKTLRNEVDQLLSSFIRSRKEVEASEFNNLVTEIRVGGGEIKTHNLTVRPGYQKTLDTVGWRP